MRWITLGTALCIAGVAAWYSIAGLMAIFAGAVIPIAIMGAVLEVGKLVTASWLHNKWRSISWWMKTYLTTAVFVLMLITSLGIFGFLSKAHLEHSISTGGTNELQIQNLQRQIRVEQRTIAVSETVLSQLDATVQTLIDYDRIRGEDGATETRKAQAQERNAENKTIGNAYANIERLQSSLAPLQREQLAIEVEVGPLKYIAELVYGDEAANHFDEAVRWVIILLIFVFDPLAVALLLVSSQEFKSAKKSEMFYDDGNMRVDPSNVVVVDRDDLVDVTADRDALDEMTRMAQEAGEYEEPFETPLVKEVYEEVIIPDDEDIEDYEVVNVDQSPSTSNSAKRRKHEDGWYTQGGTPND
jgi:hypothetical protein